MGEAWLVQPGRMEERRSTFRPLAESELRETGRDLAVRFRGELEAAVRRATRDVDRVAVSASGGVDSSSVLALLWQMARRGDLKPTTRAYALDFDAPSWGDDRPFRKSLASCLATDIDRITAEESPGFSVNKLVGDGAPCWAPTHALSVELGRRAVDGGAGAVLTGLGGDDVVDGQPVLFAHLARHGRPLEAFRRLVSLRGLIGFTPGRRVRDLFLRPLARPLFPNPMRQAQRRRATRAAFPWAGPRLRGYSSNLPTLRIRVRLSMKGRQSAIAGSSRSSVFLLDANATDARGSGLAAIFAAIPFSMMNSCDSSQGFRP